MRRCCVFPPQLIRCSLLHPPPQFLKKVQRQERIVEEVKLVLKPAYNTRRISKEAYKEILRKTVPKVHSSLSFIEDFCCGHF